MSMLRRLVCLIFGHDNLVWGAHHCGDCVIWTKCFRCGKRTGTHI